MLDEDSQLPDIATAEQQFIIPAIGQQLYNALNDTLDILSLPEPDEGDPENPTPDAALAALLPMVQKPLAAFAYWAELPAMHMRITSSGIRQTTSDGMPTAYRWQYEAAAAYLEERAYHTMEEMLRYLYIHAEDYNDIDQELQTARQQAIFQSGHHFSQYYRLRQPYRTFMHLKPLVEEVIIQHIAPSVGPVFLGELMQTPNPDTTDQQLINALRYATANLTIHKAVQKMPFKLTPDGFTIITNLSGGAATAPADQNAAIRDMGFLQKITQTDGDQALRRAIRLLQTQSSENRWATFYQSALYKGPDDYKPDSGNSSRKIFRL